MKLVKTASGKQRIKLSKKEWQDLGKKAGWMKTAQFGGSLGKPFPSGTNDGWMSNEELMPQTRERVMGGDSPNCPKCKSIFTEKSNTEGTISTYKCDGCQNQWKIDESKASNPQQDRYNPNQTFDPNQNTIK